MMSKNIKIFILGISFVVVFGAVFAFLILQKPSQKIPISKEPLQKETTQKESAVDIGAMNDDLYVELVKWQILNFPEYEKHRRKYERKWKQLLQKYNVTQENFDNFNRQLGTEKAAGLQKKAVLEAKESKWSY